ncbi:MAG: hypothetical protein M1823_004035 [Watsoniomyces obsoletus]|nr:MAG: hypothetical protein M1823_004035 [Watsoniomyces obsoletus]
MADSVPNTSDDTSGPLLKDMDHISTGGISAVGAELPERENYRVYKRRWVGLAQLALLNVIVSWDWLSFSPISGTAAAYFRVNETSINWLSTSFLFAFCACSPAALWALNKRGPKQALVIASILLLLGNWIRYAGARTSSGHYGVVMFGQILTGLAQPFVLAAPTRYSDLWFSAKGRVGATALASLANPFGGALGQLINPMWVSEAKDVPNMLLYVSIIATVCCIPSFFVPAQPPTPPCPSAAEKKIPLKAAVGYLVKSVEFWLLLIPFAVYVGFFNAFSSLINQILYPYGFSETQAGICGALLVIVGLVSSGIVSPIMGRYPRQHLTALKVHVPLLALGLFAFIWAPQTRSVVAPYVFASIIGVSAFCLMPLALEMLADVTHPVSPEITSVVGWFGGSLLGACFILIMDALKDGRDANPPYRMRRALIFEAVVAAAVVPLPLCLGLFGRRLRSKRLETDNRVQQDHIALSH